MTSTNEPNEEDMLNGKSTHLHEGISAIGHYLLYYLPKNIDDDEICEYLQKQLDDDMAELSNALITVPSEKRMLNVWHAIEQMLQTAPLSTTATINAAITMTEAKLNEAQAKYSDNHEKWLKVQNSSEVKNVEDDNNDRVQSHKLMTEGGRETFFQKAVRKLLLDVRRLAGEIKKEMAEQQAWHEDHCLGVKPGQK